MQCPFAPFCAQSGKRCELEQHCKDNFEAHARISFEQALRLTKEVEQLRKAASADAEQIADLKRHVGRLSHEMRDEHARMERLLVSLHEKLDKSEGADPVSGGRSRQPKRRRPEAESAVSTSHTEPPPVRRAGFGDSDPPPFRRTDSAASRVGLGPPPLRRTDSADFLDSAEQAPPPGMPSSIPLHARVRVAGPEFHTDNGRLGRVVRVVGADDPFSACVDFAADDRFGPGVVRWMHHDHLVVSDYALYLGQNVRIESTAPSPYRGLAATIVAAHGHDLWSCRAENYGDGWRGDVEGRFLRPGLRSALSANPVYRTAEEEAEQEVADQYVPTSPAYSPTSPGYSPTSPGSSPPSPSTDEGEGPSEAAGN